MHLKKIIFIVLSLLSTAWANNDLFMKRSLQHGVWYHSLSAEDAENIESISVEYKANHTFASRVKLKPKVNTPDVTIEGTWLVLGSKLVQTVTRSSRPDLIPLFKQSTDEILSLEPVKATFKDPQNQRVYALTNEKPSSNTPQA